jgi:hypothetical protein
MGSLLLVNQPSAGTEIDAVVYSGEAGTGTKQISSGFPLPEGLVTEQDVIDGKIVVKVTGTEVAANVTALRGRHNDGTLRSVLIQFEYAISEDATVNATVTVGGAVRAYEDPAYVLPTKTMVQNNNVILPTDTTYLCSTHVALQALLPVGGGDGDEEEFYTAFAEDRFDWLLSYDNLGTASYDHPRACIAHWCRDGDIKWQKQAIEDALSWMTYNWPSADPEDSCDGAAIVNPDGETSSNSCGIPSEWHGPRSYSFASAYLLTGYRDFWSVVAYLCQYGLGNGREDDVTKIVTTIFDGASDQPRYNYSTRYGHIVPAVLIDATVPVDGTNWTGRTHIWTDVVSWVADGLEHYQWDIEWLPFENGSGTTPDYGTTVTQGGVTATILNVYPNKNPVAASDVADGTGYFQISNRSGGSFSAGALTISGCSADATGAEEGDYRNGMTGVASWGGRGGEGGIPCFQFALTMNALIDIYLYVERDANIPPLVKSILDPLIENIDAIEAGDTGYGITNATWGTPAHVQPYLLENPINTNRNPYALPEFARAIAFVYKTEGNATVNGADYLAWYSRCIYPGNVHPNTLTMQWKHFGQFWGWCCDAPWIMAQADIDAETHTTMRTPAQWNAIPNSTPDVYRGQE